MESLPIVICRNIAPTSSPLGARCNFDLASLLSLDSDGARAIITEVMH
jgi:hypothetical protein